MATYYVRPDGNNANTGTGQSAGQAWQTLTKALGATGITSGDTVYIAPGSYNESVTIGMTSATATTSVIGDPTGSQFTGIVAGPVYWTVYTALGASPTLTSIIATSKNFLSFENIYFDGGTVSFTTSRNMSFTNCQFINGYTGTYIVTLTSPTSTALNATFTKCTFTGRDGLVSMTGQNVADSTSFVNCLGMGARLGFVGTNCQFTVFNCTFYAIRANTAIGNTSGSATFKSNFVNNLFYNCQQAIYSDTSNVATQSYNRFIDVGITLTNVASSVTSTTTFNSGMIFPYHLQQGLGTFQMFSSVLGGPNTGAGTSSGAPASDMYGVTWTGATPDTGSATYRSLSNVSPYIPTERNASAITIAPASTSQSIELYLGATGLVFNTSGLAAYYVRNQSAPVAITLVTQTPTGAWSSGGFAEISSSLTPGLYRLDVPNAAFAAGQPDVTIVVRGASGTNGAVLTVTLSSGGLTAAQTAAAVWDATASAYNTAGSMGEAGQKLTGYSLASSQTFSTTGAVGSVTGAVTVGTNNDKTGYALSTAANTTAADAVWNSTRSGHTTAGTFGQYVNAELVTPVTQSALVRMGPYQVIADGVATPMPLDIQKGAQHGVDIQCVDNNLSAIDITSATVTAKVYNSGGTLVATYSGTATYAADGRAQFTLTTTVTNSPGTYTATITRTTGASDTQVFGPLRIYVRDI